MRLFRRLITLIFADRAPEELAVMVMIRRELPRTRFAGPAMSLSHRSLEDPPSRLPSDLYLLRSKFIDFSLARSYD